MTEISLKPSITFNEPPKDPVAERIDSMTKLVQSIQRLQESAHKDFTSDFRSMLKRGVDPNVAAQCATEVELKRLAQGERILNQGRLVAPDVQSQPPRLT
jgi:hypothetical protein